MASLDNKVAFVQIKYTLESRKWYRDHCGSLRTHIAETDFSASLNFFKDLFIGPQEFVVGYSKARSRAAVESR